MKPEDFFKVDFKSSPNYKLNPQLESDLCQVRFKDEKKTQTIKRSHVGTLEDYDSYEKIVKAEKDYRQKEFQKRLKMSLASKIANFRQKYYGRDPNASLSQASGSSKMFNPHSKLSNKILSKFSDPKAKQVVNCNYLGALLEKSDESS